MGRAREGEQAIVCEVHRSGVDPADQKETEMSTALHQYVAIALARQLEDDLRLNRKQQPRFARRRGRNDRRSTT